MNPSGRPAVKDALTKIYAFTIKGEYLGKFNNRNQCATALEEPSVYVSWVLNGKRPQYNGKFYIEVEDLPDYVMEYIGNFIRMFFSKDIHKDINSIINEYKDQGAVHGRQDIP
ncbi:MAG: hypothetical protein F6K19_01515 [Cyanothece sp. SIO1E1]|nr:hypothetical protein [Cyanothece sp. SIO1E1]